MEWKPDNTLMGTRLQPEVNAAAAGLPLLSEDEAYAEMSKRLLEGWVMLNEHCPISGFPLVRKGKVTWSVRCQMEVRVDSGDSRATTNGATGCEASSSLQNIAPAPAPLAERLRNSDDVSPGPLVNPQATKGATAPEDISSELGQLLLQGWRMLDEECPITGSCPLMQEKKTGRKFSVALGKFMDELEGASKQTPTDAPCATASRPEKAPVPGDSAGHTAGTSTPSFDSAQISAAMGKLLLQGWRMLDEECPVTGACPLMQERSSDRKFSVALGKYLDELENDTAQHKKQPEHTKHRETASSVDSEDDDNEAFDQYCRKRMSQLQQKEALAVKAEPAAGHVLDVLKRAKGALLAQIEIAEAKMREPQSIEDAIAHAKLIGACATALSKLKQPLEL